MLCSSSVSIMRNPRIGGNMRKARGGAAGLSSHQTRGLRGGAKADLLEQRRKPVGVRDRHLRQDLAIQIDAAPVQRGDKGGIGSAAITAGSRDARDPQAAEIALLVASVAVGKV